MTINVTAALEASRQHAHERWLQIVEERQRTHGFDLNDKPEVTDSVRQERRNDRVVALWHAKRQLGYPARARQSKSAFLGPRDLVHLEDRDVVLTSVEHIPTIAVVCDGMDIETGEMVTKNFRWDTHVWYTSAPYLQQDHQLAVGL